MTKTTMLPVFASSKVKEIKRNWIGCNLKSLRLALKNSKQIITANSKRLVKMSKARKPLYWLAQSLRKENSSLEYKRIARPNTSTIANLEHQIGTRLSTSLTVVSVQPWSLWQQRIWKRLVLGSESPLLSLTQTWIYTRTASLTGWGKLQQT